MKGSEVQKEIDQLKSKKKLDSGVFQSNFQQLDFHIEYYNLPNTGLKRLL